ncbi:prepilin-type processing-associated H-X9-DG domain-containing protein [Paenibacillus algorifonticola]|uniref:Prepilin-type processing-associated H-X9-DG domain-containing protein n=1 Tax=Paenibacillus algorifonticola TaxID=684063 RepID=A0A1I2D0L2_9BACL|nr:beta-galactosidase [Paenibacillus algorifonticola]SFE74068.1 prepilin-type processing-associated H-X9-DG domain-containing protein [Paenibacillus algorifonticola]
MKILVFYDESFPYEGVRPSPEVWKKISVWAEIADAHTLSDRLAEASWETLIHLHGPYFPKSAWSGVKAHLGRGAGLLHAGGAPFRRPVVKDGDGWRVEREQTAYHQLLNIHDALPAAVQKVERVAASAEFPLLLGREALFGIEPTWGLTLHATKSSDIPAEMGSGGPMDAFIYPMLVGVDKDGRERAAPVVLLENMKGSFAGGRWILINQTLEQPFWDGAGAALLKELAEYVGRGVTELWLKPNYAAYEPGEQPVLTLQLQSLSRTCLMEQHWNFKLKVEHEGQASVWESTLQAKTGPQRRDLQLLRIPVPVPAVAGLHLITCEVRSDAGEVRLMTQAYWGMDRELLNSGELLACGRDYFYRGGRPVPIVGMTYMASDVSRKFLHLPNVSRWERDMAEMRRAGVNLIRTGIWTGYRNMMFADGHVVEDVLRAIDAFLLTAKRNGLEVTFTFFSFTPEAWEGVNPYLDPRAVEAQKRFIASIVSRHQGTTRVHWDLINEPSLFDPARVFEGPRALADRYERAAFSQWLEVRHSGDLTRLQERWNMTPGELPSFEAAMPPDPGDTHFDSVLLPKKWAPWLDYALFSMDMHNRWAQELASTIRSSNPRQLVTVGQDEALGGQRPSPFFYASVVDYTTVHSWWLMDQLVWDGIFTKTLDKPNLTQETGIMHIQRPDGIAKRSEEELHRILERKYAYAFSTGGAGAVQWIWNINPFMNNANESNIGALRADGTQKPETDVTYDFGRFMQEIGGLFEGRVLEDVAVVYPYSNDFSSRKLAFEATSQAVRVLAFGMNIHPRGVGEYQLEELERQPAKLIVVPSAHNFSDEAFDQLVSLAKNGSTVLWTGPLRLDAYWGAANERLRAEIGETVPGNVLREEALLLGGKLHSVSFGGRKIGQLAIDRPILQPGNGSGNASQGLVSIALGAGRFIWCPLPLELNDRWEPLQALYEEAFRASGAELELEWISGGDAAGVYGRKLQFDEGNLYIFVSEYSSDIELEIRDPLTGAHYAFVLENERTVMFVADHEGQLLSVYRPEQVSIRAFKR